MSPNTNPIKCTKRRVLIDCHVVVHPWRSDLKIEEPYTLEKELKAKQSWAKRLEELFQNHPELGVRRVGVDGDYEDQCSHCGDTWHEDIDDNGVVRCDRCGNEVEVVR